MKQEILNALNKSANVLSVMIENSYLFFLEEKPNDEINLEIMIYTQFNILHYIYHILPEYYDELNLGLQENLDKFIYRNNLLEKMPCSIEEFITDRYQIYQKESIDLMDKKIDIPFNILRNLYYKPFQYKRAIKEDIAFNEFFIDFLKFLESRKALENAFNNAIQEHKKVLIEYLETLKNN